MESIRHRVGIHAPISEVYQAVATREGLAGWWTRDVAGESRPGGKLAFSFGGPEPAAVMEVADLDAPNRVEWRCIEGPGEWLDTRITFDLTAEGDQTTVLFTHAGWEPAEFMHHCSTRWGYFLLGLKAGFEGGTAKPWPHDMKTDNWG